MMKLLVVALLTVCSSVTSHPLQRDVTNICGDCHTDNGTFYFPVEDECFEFIQCQPVGNGCMYTKMPCPAGTYFDEDVLTCNHCTENSTVGSLACDCSQNNNTFVMNITNSPNCPNMRGVSSNASIYEVVDATGNWVERPCAPGTVYQEDICTCVHGTEDDTCDGCAEDGNGNCYKRLNCSAYMQCNGNGYVGEFSCPSGTQFSLTSLVCDHTYNVNCEETTTVCETQVYLPYDYDQPITDQSGKDIAIVSEGVSIGGDPTDGFALYWNGAYLRMDRFKNTDFGTTLNITFDMNLGISSTANQAVVSNADCGVDGSIYIIQESTSNMKFRVFNTSGDEHTLDIDVSTVPNAWASPPHPASLVTLLIEDGVMTASVTTQSKSIDFYGSIRQHDCPLFIGQATGYNDFSGDMDNFRVFMCVTS